MAELHRGADYRAAVGTQVFAQIPCVVVKMGNEPTGGGIFLVVAGKCRDGTWPKPPGLIESEGSAGHDDSGWRITYCHLAGYAPNLAMSSVLERGNLMAFSGNTGMRQLPDGRMVPVSPHLHVQIEWLEDGWIDSRVFIDPQLLFGKARGSQVQRIPPGRYIAPGGAIIQPRGAPAAQAKRESVVVNVGGSGNSSINLGNGAAISTDAQLHLLP